jgi:hypothetical protein
MDSELMYGSTVGQAMAIQILKCRKAKLSTVRANFGE